MSTVIETGQFFLFLFGELVLLFVGISFLVGLLLEYIPPETMKRVLGQGRHPVLANSLGAGFGALTPFCSCSTIPILLGLIKGGAPFGASMSFLIASPLLNPIILILILSLMGLKTWFKNSLDILKVKFKNIHVFVIVGYPQYYSLVFFLNLILVFVKHFKDQNYESSSLRSFFKFLFWGWSLSPWPLSFSGISSIRVLQQPDFSKPNSLENNPFFSSLDMTSP
ncbi:MAG: permease [Desulfovibrionales bacterium]|nr:permease [Desulfovibrionales bacterium]